MTLWYKFNQLRRRAAYFMTGLLACLMLSTAGVQASEFVAGSVIKDYGQYAPVDGVKLGPNDTFQVAFDVAEGADPGEVNRRFNSLARFLNMHVGHGAQLANLKLALVVHGSATLDVLKDKEYEARKGQPNGNKALLEALQQAGVRVIVCGQSAAGHQVSKADLLSGVEMALSAMTAHALLQQAGYTLNPF